MNIGIDLDGVIFDSEKEFRVYSELYDILDLHANNIKNNKELRFQDRYQWTQEQVEVFLRKYHKQIILESNFMPGVKRILKLLKEEGHNLIIITARGGINKEMIRITEEILKNNNMEIFDKYFWAIEDKVSIVKQEDVNLMIDDYNKNIEKIAEAKIKTIYLKGSPSKELEESQYIKVCYNWGEIYRYIRELQREMN